MDRREKCSNFQFVENLREQRSEFLLKIYQEQGIEGLTNYILEINHMTIMEFPEMITKIFNDQDQEMGDK